MQQNAITPDDVSGIAALSAPYARKAQQIQGMPLAKQLEMLLGQGLDMSTAALVLKARRLKELSKANGNQQMNQSKVAEEVDQAFKQYMAEKDRAAGGISNLPVRSDMYSSADKGYAGGGIVAFAQGGPNMPRGNPEPGMSGPQIFGTQLDRAAAQNSVGPYGMQMPGPFGATASAAPAAPAASASPEADPALVSKLFGGALDYRDPYQTLLEGQMSGAGGASVDMTDLKRQIADAMADVKKLAPEDRDAALARIKKKAEEAGLNKAEVEALADNAKTLSEVTEYHNKATGRGLVKAGKAIMDNAEKRIPGNAFSQIASAIIAGGSALNEEKSGADKEFMAAKLQLRQADAALKSAIAKNNMGLIDKSDKEYTDNVANWNNAKKRLDEVLHYEAQLKGQLATHNSSLRSQAAYSAGLMRNPAYRYQGGLDSLQRQKQEYLANKDAAGAAAADAAIKQIESMQAAATGMTPGVYAAKLRADSADAVARLRIASAERIAGMKDKEIIDLEKEIAAYAGIANESKDPTLLAMVKEKQDAVDRRKAELGLSAGVTAGQAPAGNRRISVVGVERVQ